MNTKQKQLVYELVADNCEHRTAEEVYRAAKTRMPQIAMGTVYRNLSQLVSEGKIRKIGVPNGPDRYDGCVRAHEHLFCGHLVRRSDRDDRVAHGLPDYVVHAGSAWALPGLQRRRRECRKISGTVGDFIASIGFSSSKEPQLRLFFCFILKNAWISLLFFGICKEDAHTAAGCATIEKNARAEIQEVQPDEV